jgi:hypothetical protein
MEKTCPHCGYSVNEEWHRSHGMQKIEKGSVEGGVPAVGRIEVRRETIVMVYICELTNLPFFLTTEKAQDVQR